MNTALTRRICSPAGRSSASPLRASSPCGRECIVLDEPTAMLDPHGRDGGRCRPSERLNRETGITVILITHHMDRGDPRGPRDRHGAGAHSVRTERPRRSSRRWNCCSPAGLTVPADDEAALCAAVQAGFDLPLDALSMEECAQALLPRSAEGLTNRFGGNDHWPHYASRQTISRIPTAPERRFSTTPSNISASPWRRGSLSASSGTPVPGNPRSFSI